MELQTSEMPPVASSVENTDFIVRFFQKTTENGV